MSQNKNNKIQILNDNILVKSIHTTGQNKINVKNSINMNNSTITGLSNPVESSDAASKGWTIQEVETRLAAIDTNLSTTPNMFKFTNQILEVLKIILFKLEDLNFRC